MGLISHFLDIAVIEKLSVEERVYFLTIFKAASNIGNWRIEYKDHSYLRLREAKQIDCLNSERKNGRYGKVVKSQFDILDAFLTQFFNVPHCLLHNIIIVTYYHLSLNIPIYTIVINGIVILLSECKTIKKWISSSTPFRYCWQVLSIIYIFHLFSVWKGPFIWNLEYWVQVTLDKDLTLPPGSSIYRE